MGATKWLLRKFKSINKERMNRTIEVISKESGKSKGYIIFDMALNFITRGCGYTDYFRGNYINLTSSEKDTFVTAKSFYKFLSYMNDKKYQVILNDKLVFIYYIYVFILLILGTLTNLYSKLAYYDVFAHFMFGFIGCITALYLLNLFTI